jgi:2-octaprenylphenol hydroxylase
VSQNTINSEVKYYDVVIVGAGLVGASLAALLSQRLDAQKPVSIAIIDGGNAPELPVLTQKKPEFDPRVVALTHSSQALFEELGVWQKIKAQRACEYTDMCVWDDQGTASIHFSSKEIQQTHLGSIAENSIVLDAVLQLLSTNESVIFYRGDFVEKMEQAAGGENVLHCASGLQLQADLIVAADGGQSKLRELAGMETREWDYQHKAIVATVESENSHQHTAWQNFLSSGPLAFLPLEHSSERYCSIVWSLETEKADQLMSLDDATFLQQLEHAFESRLGKVQSISRRFCFPLRQRHAVHYYKDNMVVIGDAAHTIHPLAGQGVNLGLLDASALASELVRASNRGLSLSDDSVLRRYQRKRKAHNLEVMLLMEAFKRLFGAQQLWLRWLRNTGLKIVNDFKPLKNWLAKQAVRYDGE